MTSLKVELTAFQCLIGLWWSNVNLIFLKLQIILGSDFYERIDLGVLGHFRFSAFSFARWISSLAETSWKLAFKVILCTWSIHLMCWNLYLKGQIGKHVLLKAYILQPVLGWCSISCNYTQLGKISWKKLISEIRQAVPKMMHNQFCCLPSSKQTASLFQTGVWRCGNPTRSAKLS